MVTFIDGPAIGRRLNLRRTPVFLRVVVEADGRFDALDQLDDDPTPTETIYAYRLTGQPSRGIACTRGKGCRTFVHAEYRLCEDQPIGSESRESWSQWTEEQAVKQGLAT